MTKSSRSLLDQEVARFRSWADEYDGPRQGEWECNYPHWPAFYGATLAYITDSQVDEWDDTIADALLYAIARDNEIEYIARHLGQMSEKLFALVHAALRAGERDAQWQLAEQLAHFPDRQETEPLLLALAANADEYVRRRALMALGNIKSVKVETLVGQAWDSGDEYQRMAVLDALHNLQSPRLARYLELAQEDGRKYLTGFADRIRRGELPSQ
jgi:HEAT repeat protein